MNHKSTKLIVTLLMGVFLLSGCAAPAETQKVEKISDSEIETILESANTFVNREVEKLPTLKYEYTNELLLLDSAFYSDTSSIGPEFQNATWVPNSMPSETSCDVNPEDVDGVVSVECFVDYGEKGSCNMSLGPFGENGKDLPTSADNLYSADGKPQYFFVCSYLEDFPLAEDVKLMSQPEKVKASVEDISRALLTYGGCNANGFEVRNIGNYSNKFVKQYMVVSTHVDDAPGLGGDQMSFFDLWMWPQFDLYQLRGGLGWDSYFGCQMDSEGNPVRISTTGETLNDNLG